MVFMQAHRRASVAVFKRFMVTAVLEIGESIKKRFEGGEDPFELEQEDELSGVLFAVSGFAPYFG